MRPTRRETLRTLAAAPAAALFPMSLACASQEDDPDPGPVSAAGDAVVDGLAHFGLALHGRLGDGNVFTSPWSVWTALAMLSEGARGATREQLVAALGLEGAAARPDNVRAGAKELRGRLARAGKKVSLTTADAIWADETFDLNEDFARELRDAYAAGLERLDFRGDPEGARGRINRWVEKKTKDRIADLMPEGSIDSRTELVLTDAIHFKGSWLHAFDEERTRDGAFTLSDGSEVRARMMTLGEEEEFPMTALVDEDAKVSAKAIELPYIGERVSFVAIVPDRHDGLGDLESWLDARRLRDAMAALRPSSTDVVVPRMKLELRFDLIDPLKEMGVTDVFVGGVADLSGLSESGRKDLVVTEAVHATFLEVDEEGTEAAAATGIAVGRAMVAEPLRLDRPFLFLIRERTSGAVLFLGRMADPTA